MEIPLLNLPVVVQELVCKNFDFFDAFLFSTLSKQTKRVARTSFHKEDVRIEYQGVDYFRVSSRERLTGLKVTWSKMPEQGALDERFIGNFPGQNIGFEFNMKYTSFRTYWKNVSVSRDAILKHLKYIFPSTTVELAVGILDDNARQSKKMFDDFGLKIEHATIYWTEENRNNWQQWMDLLHDVPQISCPKLIDDYEAFYNFVPPSPFNLDSIEIGFNCISLETFFSHFQNCKHVILNGVSYNQKEVAQIIEQWIEASNKWNELVIGVADDFEFGDSKPGQEVTVSVPLPRISDLFEQKYDRYDGYLVQRKNRKQQSRVYRTQLDVVFETDFDMNTIQYD